MTQDLTNELVKDAVYISLTPKPTNETWIQQ